MSVFAPASAHDLEGLTVPALLMRRAADVPQHIALSAWSIRGFRDRLSYAQLAWAMHQVGTGLLAQGIRAGDRVAVFLDNQAGREAILTALGCLDIGAAVVALNTRYADEELAHALALVQPARIVVTAQDAPRMRALVSCGLILVDPPSDPQSVASGAAAWPEPAAAHAHRRESRPPGSAENNPTAQHTGALLFTSGTTARAKAVVHSHRSMLHAGLAMGQALGLTVGDLYQGAFPFFTSSCLNLACLSCWVHGAGFVMENALDDERRLALIESECTTFYHGVPSVLRFMLDAAQRSGHDLRKVRRIAYGGAAMPVATIERIARQWPWMQQVHVWGMTESGPAGAYLPPEELPAKAGSIGRAMPYCQLRVIDEQGRDVAAGTPGQLCFRGPSMALGYFDDPAASAQTFQDGWLHTGDVVVQDGEGWLTYVDRQKDIINRGGLKVSSAAVEAVLHRFPGVGEAAVVAVAHEALGEDVAACVVLAEGVPMDIVAMQSWCKAHLADYAVPRHWLQLTALPRNPMGKVLKHALRERFAGQRLESRSC
jgi:acyl-CoA synthetase (AMP-forming)/AMP-acid ligase II